MFFKKKIFRYIRSFGLYHGLALFFKIRRAGDKPLISFRIPGLPHPVFIRRQSSDFMVFEEIFIDQQYKTDFSKGSVLTVMDAGANIGLSALYFLKSHSPEKIICLEPEDDNFKMLEKNLSGYKNILLIKKGLWHSRQLLKIVDMTADNWGFELTSCDDTAGGIQGISINDLMQEYGLNGIDLLKIDIEGSEKEVFERNNSWVFKIKHLIIEVHEGIRPGAFDAVKSAMTTARLKNAGHSSPYIFSKTDE
jgi:FkbM family methyltransferase